MDNIPVFPRPRSVTFIAITFGLLATWMGCLSAMAILKYPRHYHTLILVKGLISFSLALIYAWTARGVWRLSPMFRIIAIIVAAFNALALLVILCVTPDAWPSLDKFDFAEWLGAGIGALIYLSFFASPLYILTRPAVATAFKVQP